MLGQVVLTEELSRDLVGERPATDDPVRASPGLQPPRPSRARSSGAARHGRVPAPRDGRRSGRPGARGPRIRRDPRGTVAHPLRAGNRRELGGPRRCLAPCSPAPACPATGEWTVGVHINVEESEDRTVTAHVASGRGRVRRCLSSRSCSRCSSGVGSAARCAPSPRRPAWWRATGSTRSADLRPSWLREMDDANRSFNRMVEGLRERQVIRQTLGRYVPEKVAHELLSAGGRIEPTEVRATVLFCDLVGFTSLTETARSDWDRRRPQRLVLAHDGDPRTARRDRDPVPGGRPPRDLQHSRHRSRARAPGGPVRRSRCGPPPAESARRGTPAPDAGSAIGDRGGGRGGGRAPPGGSATRCTATR